MYLASFEDHVAHLSAVLWGWPLILFVACAGLVFTVAFSGVQFRYFFKGWGYVFTPETGKASADTITPFQAFINALSSSLGNGAIAGVATALYSGGPGATFWVFILGFFSMAIRFAEVFASTYYTSTGVITGGPMVYLRKVPGGNALVYIYAFFLLLLAFTSGNSMQTNSISLGVQSIVAVDPSYIALTLFLVLLYIMFGGAQRIMKFAEAIIPVKVGVFFVGVIAVLVYNAAAIPAALGLIFRSAWGMQQFAAGVMGYTMQTAISYGISRGLNATEAGLGNAGVLFGSTKSTNPIRSSAMSMITTFISTHLVCCSVMLAIVASGVWNSGLTSTPLVIAAFSTVFGWFGPYVVTFLSIAFGLGVLVAYAFVGRQCWLFVTNDKAEWLYTILFCIIAAGGAIASVSLIWNLINVVVAGLIISNLYALIVLAPDMGRGFRRLQQRRQ